jgi:hypothetical protein
MAFGGISLAAVADAEIRENKIENNGATFISPICGIFILYGNKIRISGNKILQNGIRNNTDDSAAKPGERGGIVILLALQLLDGRNTYSSRVPASDAVPAASIFDNIVDHPYGHALFLIAFGQTSVIGNTFTSKGNASNLLSTIAGAVLILNLGVSKDLLFLLALKPGFLYGMSTIFGDPAAAKDNASKIEQLTYLPSGKVLFDNNQVMMDMRNHMKTRGISSVFIGSLDDISFNSNQTECTGFLEDELKKTDLVLFNTVLAGMTVRSNSNRFTDGIIIPVYSLLSFGYAATAIGNISTHCLLLISNTPAVEANNTVLISTNCDRSKTAYSTVLVKSKF